MSSSGHYSSVLGFTAPYENGGIVDSWGVEIGANSVSYTHLDVYKRQTLCLPLDNFLAGTITIERLAIFKF